MIVAAHAAIHKLNVDVLPNPFQVAVMPYLERECRSAATALIRVPLIVAAGGVGLDLVWLSEGNIDVASVGLPARLARRKVLVGIRDAPIMFFAELVFG